MHPLLVGRPIGEAHSAKAPFFVELARPDIGLEAPKLERGDAGSLHGLQQQTSSARADKVRMGVEHANFLPIARQKRDNGAVTFGDQHFALLQDDVFDEPTILFHRVEHRQEGQQPEGRR